MCLRDNTNALFILRNKIHTINRGDLIFSNNKDMIWDK